MFFSVLLSVKLNFKWFNKLQFLVLAAFLDSVPTFMEMAFVLATLAEQNSNI